jgi:acyl carrier protein
MGEQNRLSTVRYMSVTVTEIRNQLTKMGFIGASAPLADEDSLMDSGAIDSLRLMDLVTRLEALYGITVDQDDLIPENFDSIEGIARYVAQHDASNGSMSPVDPDDSN